MPTPNRVQPARSSVSKQRNVAGRLPGELYTNFADLQIGVVSPAIAALDLVGVRFFSAGAQYAVGDYAIQAGQLYRCIATISTPGAFNGSQWAQVATLADLTSQLSNYLPIAGGNLTGPLTLSIVKPASTYASSLLAGATTAGTRAFNAYADSATTWRAFATGCSALLGHNVSTGVLTFYGNPSIAKDAPVVLTTTAALANGGDFTATRDIQANRNLIAESATYFSGTNASDFYAQANTTDRLFVWAGNWYDYWHNADGSRHWFNNGFDGMALDAAGNLSVHNTIWAGGNISTAASVNANGNMNCGGALGVTGNAQVNGGFTVLGAEQVNGNLTTSNTLTANTVHSAGNLQVDGAGQVNGNMGVMGNLTVSGSFTIGTLNATIASISNYITFPGTYGHAMAWGWNGVGVRVRVDGADKGYQTFSPNIYSWDLSGSAAQGQYDSGAFAWNVFLGRDAREAQALADEAKADIESIKTLRAMIEALSESVRVLDARVTAACGSSS